jgi:hypothetical protein
VPRESIECERRESRVTMMWSTTGIPSTLPAAMSLAVVAMSSGLGLGSRVLGGRPSSALEAFDGERCDRAMPSDWVSVPTSDRLWATERDGDVVLVTAGD